MNQFRFVRALGVMLVSLLLASSCGTSTPATTAETDSATTPDSTLSGAAANSLPTVEEVAPNLASLTELLTVHSAPVQQVFDASGGEMALADGSTLQVPADAFDTPIEVTAVLLDVRYDRYLEFPPEARIYQVSTATDVSLSKPVVVEIPGASDTVQVFGFEDTVWVEETLPSTPTTRIEISHFSVVQHVVMSRPTSEQLRAIERIRDLWTNEEGIKEFSEDPNDWVEEESDLGVSWNFVEERRFASQWSSASQTVINDLAWDSKFPFPAGPGRSTKTTTTEQRSSDQAATDVAGTDEAGDSGGATSDDVFRPEQADLEINPAATSTTVVSTAVDIEGDDSDPIAITEAEETTTTRPTTNTTPTTTTTSSTTTSTTTTSSTTTSTTTTTAAPAVNPIAGAQQPTVLCNTGDQSAIRITQSFIMRDFVTGENPLDHFDGAQATMTLSGGAGTTSQDTATVSGALMTFDFVLSQPMGPSERLTPSLQVGGVSVGVSVNSIGFSTGNCTY